MRSDSRGLRGRWWLAWLLALQMWAAAPAWAQQPIPERLGVRLGIVNYLGEALDPVSIDQVWAGNARPRSYSSGTCCVSIATRWTPGMTMRVAWNSDSMFRRGDKRLVAREVPVLPFEPFHDGFIWAVFLPGGEVYLQPAAARPGAEGFLQGLPQPGDETPADLRRFIENNPLPSAPPSR